MSFSHKARQGREENISSRKVAKTQRKAKEDFKDPSQLSAITN
jgi:hypothetical protein